jgi:2-polyprenyl-3-methyl-5-hydroxy-6-metoxy-1,4-benzoquinol methylase
MEVADAVELIESGFRDVTRKETWGDLGCGGGTFTKALAALLPQGSKIFAVDKENQRIRSGQAEHATIEFIKLDFVRDALPFTALDGILMANALHFVKDKRIFIENLTKHIKPEGRLIIVEYDTEQRSPWVPYPITFDNLRKTFSVHGFDRIEKLGERKSIYRTGKMYACSIER